jgi:hypothetical protein
VNALSFVAEILSLKDRDNMFWKATVQQATQVLCNSGEDAYSNDVISLSQMIARQKLWQTCSYNLGESTPFPCVFDSKILSRARVKSAFFQEMARFSLPPSTDGANVEGASTDDPEAPAQAIEELTLESQIRAQGVDVLFSFLLHKSRVPSADTVPRAAQLVEHISKFMCD